MIRFFIFICVIFTSLSCSVSDVSKDNPGNSGQQVTAQNFNVTIEVYQNRMPLSDNSTYVVLDLKPKEGIAKDNYKIAALSASGTKGTWEARKFDFNEFNDKRQPYQNVAREFDPSIGSVYDFRLVIQYESGDSETYELDNVSLQVVY